MFEKINENVISYIYNISKQPVKLHELLEANALFNEGMKLDGTRLGFRLRTGRAYVVFIFLIHIVIIHKKKNQADVEFTLSTFSL